MIYIRDCSLKFKLEILQKETTENNAQNYEMFILSFICMHFILLEGGCCVHNATFNNISAISWQSVLLVEETGRPKENHRPIASH
jgi:hypothetical protein